MIPDVDDLLAALEPEDLVECSMVSSVAVERSTVALLNKVCDLYSLPRLPDSRNLAHYLGLGDLKGVYHR